MKTTTYATAYNADMLEALFSMNKWEPMDITCPDGAVVYVTPCCYSDTPCCEHTEYYLVDSDIPWSGCDTLEQLADELNKHGEQLKKLEAERNEIRAYFDKHERDGWDSDSLGWYSDWHKDLYGYRPHGHVCGTYVEPYPGACISVRRGE